MPLRSERRKTQAGSDGAGTVGLLVCLALLSVSCSGDAKGGDTADMDAGGFKSATVDNQEAGAGLTTLITLPFTTPSDGFVSISATGNCAVVEALPIGSVLAVEILTTPSDRTPYPGDATFLIGGGNTSPAQGSFAVMRVLPVSAGENAAYLVVNNPSNGGLLHCSASMLAVFQSHQLP